MNRAALPPSDSADSQRRTASSAVLAAVGVGSAFLATGCCVGPLLAAAGLGGAGLIVRMEPYRPVLAFGSAAFMLAAVVATRCGPARSTCGCSPADTWKTRAGRYTTYAAAVLALALIAAPYVLERWAP